VCVYNFVDIISSRRTNITEDLTAHVPLQGINVLQHYITWNKNSPSAFHKDKTVAQLF